jgi:hypothetical protein
MNRRLAAVIAFVAALALSATAQQLVMSSRLAGPLTADIDKLRKAKELARFLDDLELQFVDDPAWGEPSDTSYLSDEEKKDPDTAANVRAMTATNKLIAWFGQGPMGYVGLWRGPKNHALVDAPVVVLDTEGQYRIVAATVADFIAVSVDESEFSAAVEALLAAGFHPRKSPEAISDALAFGDDDPNDYSHALYNEDRVKRGLRPIP